MGRPARGAANKANASMKMSCDDDDSSESIDGKEQNENENISSSFKLNEEEDDKKNRNDSDNDSSSYTKTNKTIASIKSNNKKSKSKSKSKTTKGRRNKKKKSSSSSDEDEDNNQPVRYSSRKSASAAKASLAVDDDSDDEFARQNFMFGSDSEGEKEYKNYKKSIKSKKKSSKNILKGEKGDIVPIEDVIAAGDDTNFAEINSNNSSDIDSSDEEKDPNEVDYRIQHMLACKSLSPEEWRSILEPMETREVNRGSVLQMPDNEFYSTSPQAIERFLIKWVHASYLHVSWETESDLIELVGSTAAKTAIQKLRHREIKGESIFEDLARGEYFEPSFIQIDRIIDIEDDSVKVLAVDWEKAALPPIEDLMAEKNKEKDEENDEGQGDDDDDGDEDKEITTIDSFFVKENEIESENDVFDTNINMVVDKNTSPADICAADCLVDSEDGDKNNIPDNDDDDDDEEELEFDVDADESDDESELDITKAMAEEEDDDGENAILAALSPQADAGSSSTISCNDEKAVETSTIVTAATNDVVEKIEGDNKSTKVMDDDDDDEQPQRPKRSRITVSRYSDSLLQAADGETKTNTSTSTGSKRGRPANKSKSKGKKGSKSTSAGRPKKKAVRMSSYLHSHGAWLTVKWEGMTYGECSIESTDDLRTRGIDYEKQLRSFYEREQSPPATASQLNRLKRALHTATSTHSYIEATEPPSLKGGSLRDYQWEGVRWMLFNWSQRRNSILADEMGLGKTIQTAAFMHYLSQNQGVRGPYLIVAPLSVMINWYRELSAWTDLDVVVYHGSSEDRELIREKEFYYLNRPKSDGHKVTVVVTTPETCLAADAKTPTGRVTRALAKIPWALLVVDEAHKLKNHDSRLSKCLRDDYSYTNCLLLTGTPLQNTTEELWTLLNFVAPDDFSSKATFADKFGDLQNSNQLDKLKERIGPYLLRREKENVEKSVPPKEELIIEVELTAPQKQYYRAIYEMNTNFLCKSGSKEMPSLTNLAMEIRKCCNHPYLVKGAETAIAAHMNEVTPIEQMVQSSGKMVLLDKLLPKLKGDGHRVLIFSQFRLMLNILEDYLIMRGLSYERIDGAITGKKRQNAIDRYSAPNSDVFVMLLSTRAGGVGINLTSADTVIIYDSDWNPQNDLQAQARAHRIGQEKSVKVYRLLTRKSYEMRMFEVASMKLGLDYAVMHNLDGFKKGKKDDAQHMSSMSKKELENLLKHGAYDIFNESKDGSSTGDDTSKEFCEEDINQILNRATKVVHDGKKGIDNATDSNGNSSNNKSQSFAKASFVAAGDTSSNNVNVDDPDFWTKIVGLSVNADKEEESRRRKCREALTEGAYKEPGMSFKMVTAGYSDSDEEPEVHRKRLSKLEKQQQEMMEWPLKLSGTWAQDVSTVMSSLCIHGLGNWEDIKFDAKVRWNDSDTAHACRLAILQLLVCSAINFNTSTEDETASFDIYAVMSRLATSKLCRLIMCTAALGMAERSADTTTDETTTMGSENTNVPAIPEVLESVLLRQTVATTVSSNESSAESTNMTDGDIPATATVADIALGVTSSDQEKACSPEKDAVDTVSTTEVENAGTVSSNTSNTSSTSSTYDKAEVPIVQGRFSDWSEETIASQERLQHLLILLQGGRLDASYYHYTVPKGFAKQQKRKSAAHNNSNPDENDNAGDDKATTNATHTEGEGLPETEAEESAVDKAMRLRSERASEIEGFLTMLLEDAHPITLYNNATNASPAVFDFGFNKNTRVRAQNKLQQLEDLFDARLAVNSTVGMTAHAVVTSSTAATSDVETIDVWRNALIKYLEDSEEYVKMNTPIPFPATTTTAPTNATAMKEGEHTDSKDPSNIDSSEKSEGMDDDAANEAVPMELCTESTTVTSLESTGDANELEKINSATAATDTINTNEENNDIKWTPLYDTFFIRALAEQGWPEGRRGFDRVRTAVVEDVYYHRNPQEIQVVTNTSGVATDTESKSNDDGRMDKETMDTETEDTSEVKNTSNSADIDINDDDDDNDDESVDAVAEARRQAALTDISISLGFNERAGIVKRARILCRILRGVQPLPKPANFVEEVAKPRGTGKSKTAKEPKPPKPIDKKKLIQTVIRTISRVGRVHKLYRSLYQMHDKDIEEGTQVGDAEPEADAENQEDRDEVNKVINSSPKDPVDPEGNTNPNPLNPEEVFDASSSYLVPEDRLLYLLSYSVLLDTVRKGYSPNEHTASVVVISDIREIIDAILDARNKAPQCQDPKLKAPSLDATSYPSLAAADVSPKQIVQCCDAMDQVYNIRVAFAYLGPVGVESYLRDCPRITSPGANAPLYQRDQSLPVWWSYRHDVRLLFRAITVGCALGNATNWKKLVAIDQEAEQDDDHARMMGDAAVVGENSKDMIDYGFVALTTMPSAFRIPSIDLNNGKEWITEMSGKIGEKRLNKLSLQLSLDVLQTVIARNNTSETRTSLPPHSPIPKKAKSVLGSKNGSNISSLFKRAQAKKAVPSASSSSSTLSLTSTSTAKKTTTPPTKTVEKEEVAKKDSLLSMSENSNSVKSNESENSVNEMEQEAEAEALPEVTQQEKSNLVKTLFSRVSSSGEISITDAASSHVESDQISLEEVVGLDTKTPGKSSSHADTDRALHVNQLSAKQKTIDVTGGNDNRDDDKATDDYKSKTFTVAVDTIGSTKEVDEKKNGDISGTVMDVESIEDSNDATANTNNIANNGSTPTNKGDSENQANYSSKNTATNSGKSSDVKKASAGQVNVKGKSQGKTGSKERQKSRGQSQKGPSLLNFFTKKQSAPLVDAPSITTSTSVCSEVVPTSGADVNIDKE